MGIFDFIFRRDKYAKYHKYLVDYNLNDYQKTKKEFFNIVQSDEIVLKLLNKYNLDFQFWEQLWSACYSVGCAQVIRGKFVPIILLTREEYLSYILKNLKDADLSTDSDFKLKEETELVLGTCFMNFSEGEDLVD